MGRRQPFQHDGSVLILYFYILTLCGGAGSLSYSTIMYDVVFALYVQQTAPGWKFGKAGSLNLMNVTIVGDLWLAFRLFQDIVMVLC